MTERLKLEEGWITLLLLWLLIATTAAALLAADLIDGLEILLVVGTGGLIFGLLLAKSSFPNRVAHIFSLTYGFSLIALMVGQILPEDLSWREKIINLIARQVEWLSKAMSGGTSRDGLIFVLQTAGIFWLLGYTSAWYTFRKPRVWRVILPTGLVLLSVIYYYYGPKPLALYLVVYVLLALIYIARTHLVAQEKIWRSAAVRYEPNIQLGFIRAAFLAGVVILVVSWNLPVLGASASVSDALSGTSQPWRRFQDGWTRLFSSLRSYGNGTNDPYQDSLVLGGPRTVGNAPVMDIYVSGQLPVLYWGAIALDRYDGQGGWQNTTDQTLLHYPEDGVLNPPFTGARSVITQTVVNYIPNSSTIYGASEIIGSNQQMLVDLRYDDVGNMLVNRLRTRYVLRQGDRYEVISRVSTVTAQNLRTAGNAYPSWVTDAYLQLPESVTQATIDLAQELTADLSNPYDKAIVVRDYLRNTITYNDQIPAPPDDVEPVDYILFVSQEGYCNYYAAAMALMLRSQGIPTRLMMGYAQGEFVADANAYRVRANNAHTWVEVYFPSYGWIEFEPTASIPVTDRPEGTENGDSGNFASPSFSNRDELLGDELEPTPPAAEDRPLPEDESVGAAASQEQAALLLQAVGAVVVVVVAAFVVVVGNQVNKRVEGNVEGSYGRLESWGRWLGVLFRPVHTPYERADLLVSVVPEGKTSIRNLTQQYVLNRFSPGRGANYPLDFAHEWRILRPLLIRQALARRLSRKKN